LTVETGATHCKRTLQQGVAEVVVNPGHNLSTLSCCFSVSGKSSLRMSPPLSPQLSQKY